MHITSVVTLTFDTPDRSLERNRIQIVRIECLSDLFHKVRFNKNSSE